MEGNTHIDVPGEPQPSAVQRLCCRRAGEAGSSSSHRRAPTWVAWSAGGGAAGDGDGDGEEVCGRSRAGAPRRRRAARWCSARHPNVVLLHASVVLNLCLLAAGVVVYVRTRSQLVLVQATDSLLDVGAGAVLAYSARVGRRPADGGHQYGHRRAEPLGALVVAVVTCVLAVEVLASAVLDLAAAAHPEPDVAIAAVLGAKASLKVGLIFAILFLTRLKPASDVGLNALFVDTRNDIVVCVFSLGGYALVVAGHGWADGFLAVIVAGYVAFNGHRLARENLGYLMGGAPPEEVIEDIRLAASAVAGVERVGRVRAQYLGTDLQAELRIFVSPNLSVRETIAIAEAVRQLLVDRGLVQMVSIYVDLDGSGRQEAHPDQIISRSESELVHHHISFSDSSAYGAG